MIFEKECFFLGYGDPDRTFPNFIFVAENEDAFAFVPIMLDPSLRIENCPKDMSYVQIEVVYYDGYLVCTNIKLLKKGE